MLQANWIGRSAGAELIFAVAETRRTVPRLHNAAGHRLRRDLCRAGAGAPLVERITTPEQRAAVAAYVERTQNTTESERTNAEREKTGVFTGAHAINPATGAARADLDRGLCAGAVRHRRDHGRARPRRARLRVRPRLRPADHRGRRRATRASPRRRTPAPARWSTPGNSTGMRPTRASAAFVAWLAERGRGAAARDLPPARLADLAPALLGAADPGRLLPEGRHRAGAGGSTAGAAAGDRGFPPHRHRQIAAGLCAASSTRPARSAAAPPSARPTSPIPSSTPRGTSCAIPAPSGTTARSIARGSRSGCR